MNHEPITQTDMTKKKEDKYCILIHIYGILKKWYWSTYLQGNNREIDRDNRLKDRMERERAWDKWKE